MSNIFDRISDGFSKARHGIEHEANKAKHTVEGAFKDAKKKANPKRIIDEVEHEARGIVKGIIHEVEEVAHKAEGEVKGIVRSGKKELNKVVHEAEGGLKTAVHEIEETFEHRLKDKAEEITMHALHEVEEKFKELGAEVAIAIIREGIELFVDLLHDAIPDVPQSIRISAFEFVWKSLDARLDKMVEFVEHPPHGVDGLLKFVKVVQPDYIIVRPEGRAAAVLASSNILGVEGKVTISVDKLESAAGKVAHKFGISI